MDVTERSRERVDDALDRLDERFGVERVVEDRWTVSPAEYERTCERFEAGTLGGAGAWVARGDSTAAGGAREEGAVLLVRERGRDGWSEPSGKHEPGETLAETARREVCEETGVRIDLRGVALAQRAVHVDRADPDRPPLHRLVAVFAGRHAGGTARPREPGIEAARWFDDHPDDLLYGALAELPVPARW